MITAETMLELAEANRQLALVIAKAFEEMKPGDRPEYVSTKEAEQMTGFNSARLRYLVRTGKLTAKHISERVIVYRREDLERLTSCLV